MTADKYRDAVSQCLSGCYSAANPLAALAAFVGQLRSDPDWSPEEVDRVETNARRILTAVLDQSESD